MGVEELQLAVTVRRHEHRQHLAAEQARQHLDMDEEVGTRGDPSRVIERETSTWHNHMHVRMMGEREPQLCSTAVIPIRAPRRLGSLAMASVVSAAAFISRL